MSEGKDTLVFQSFRTQDVPSWLTQCMDTARSWAEAQGFNYIFLDDVFLSLAPAWMKAKSPSILPITDFCRLLWARKFLAEGWKRVVWIDADVLVFEPTLLSIETQRPELLCREYIFIHRGGDFSFEQRINNSISVYTPRSHFLPYYIDSCIYTAQSARRLERLSLGTEVLTKINEVFKFDFLRNVGCFSPYICNSINTDKKDFLHLHRMIFGRPLAAANMVRSLIESANSDAMCAQAVDRLLSTRGAVVNDF